MAITRKPSNTIYIGGPKVEMNEYPAGEAITPGHLIELYSKGGVASWRKHPTSTEQVPFFVAVENMMMNKGIDDDYVVDDLVQAIAVGPGTVFNGLLPSGENIAICAYLQSNGGGTLKAATATTAAANVAKFQAIEAIGAITELTRCLTHVVQ